MQPGSYRTVPVYEFAALAVVVVALSTLRASCVGGVEDFDQPLVAPRSLTAPTTSSPRTSFMFVPEISSLG